jgi:hypothetical protein
MWSIITISKDNLSRKDKNLIVDLIDNESHNAIEKYRFVLHDILEKKNSSEAIIESKKCAAENVRIVLIDNTNHKVIYKKIKKSRI